jgi:hypothetical protein
MMMKKGAVLRLFFLSVMLNIATANFLDALFGIVDDSPIDRELEQLTGNIDFRQLRPFGQIECSLKSKIK